MAVRKAHKSDGIELISPTGGRRKFDHEMAHALLGYTGRLLVWALPADSPFTWTQEHGFEPRTTKPKAEEPEA